MLMLLLRPDDDVKAPPRYDGEADQISEMQQLP